MNLWTQNLGQCLEEKIREARLDKERAHQQNCSKAGDRYCVF